MEKVLKILIVFALLMLLIFYSFRTRRWREYRFSHRMPELPPAADEPEGLSSIISHEGIALVTDESTGLIYRYESTGVLTIHRLHSSAVLQRLDVPPAAYFLSVDVIKDEIHLHQEGEIYVYSRSK
ncbi:MAG TPA: hypothetical protein VHC96_12575 [Puia sp.]|jgi:hypothetical protein|nr:hypothetical protein [Puia sp.]